MRENQMSIEAGAAGLSLKAGLFSALFLGFVSVAAVVLGFTVVPLTPGRKAEDAERRIGGGLLFAFLGGLPAVSAFAAWHPAYFPFCMAIVGASGSVSDPHTVLGYVLGATPFFALCAVIGFWIVAAGMRALVNRQDKDLIQIGQEAAQALRDIKNEVHP